MNTKATSSSMQKAVPFIISNMEEIEEEMYDKAINDSVILRESYDPKTQTSKYNTYAGTAETVTTTWTGVFWSDDSEHDDD